MALRWRGDVADHHAHASGNGSDIDGGSAEKLLTARAVAARLHSSSAVRAFSAVSSVTILRMASMIGGASAVGTTNSTSSQSH